MTTAPTCSAITREQQEPLAGSIKPTETWYLLEYNEPFGSPALEVSNLSDAIKTKLAKTETSNTLLIKQPGQRGERDGKITFFIGKVTEDNPRLYRYDLEQYDELLELDLENRSVEPTTESLYLVCTNNQHDRCCGLHGVPFYREMTKYAHDSVWQSSHIGGHRFAPTMYCFPHGISYGYLAVEDAQKVVESYQSGKLLNDKYRGRVLYDKPIQAAEYFLRKQIEFDDVSAFHLAECSQDDNLWQIQLQIPQNNQIFTLTLQERSAERVTNCEGLTTKMIPYFHLIECKQVGFDKI